MRSMARARVIFVVIRHLKALLDYIRRNGKAAARALCSASASCFGFARLELLNGQPRRFLARNRAPITRFIFLGLFHFAIPASLTFSHVLPLVSMTSWSLGQRRSSV
jgi:hypothetical protein